LAAWLLLFNYMKQRRERQSELVRGTAL